MTDQKRNALKFINIQLEAVDKIITACDTHNVHYLRISYENVKEVLKQYKKDIKEFAK